MSVGGVGDAPFFVADEGPGVDTTASYLFEPDDSTAERGVAGERQGDRPAPRPAGGSSEGTATACRERRAGPDATPVVDRPA